MITLRKLLSSVRKKRIYWYAESAGDSYRRLILWNVLIALLIIIARRFIIVFIYYITSFIIEANSRFIKTCAYCFQVLFSIFRVLFVLLFYLCKFMFLVLFKLFLIYPIYYNGAYCLIRCLSNFNYLTHCRDRKFSFAMKINELIIVDKLIWRQRKLLFLYSSSMGHYYCLWFDIG